MPCEGYIQFLWIDKLRKDHGWLIEWLSLQSFLIEKVRKWHTHMLLSSHRRYYGDKYWNMNNLKCTDGYSALWLLMPWCKSTRPSVTTVLTKHPLRWPWPDWNRFNFYGLISCMTITTDWLIDWMIGFDMVFDWKQYYDTHTPTMTYHDIHCYLVLEIWKHLKYKYHKPSFSRTDL